MLSFSLKPIPYTIPIFLVLAGLVFFVPFLETGPIAGNDGLFLPGHYPLIYLFLLSAVVVMDIFWGDIIIADWLWFLAFLASFFLLYLAARGLSALVGPWLIERKARRRTEEDEAGPEPRYVLDLAGKDQEIKK